MKCVVTIEYSGFDQNEIAATGLTAESARKIDAPRIKECFLNLKFEKVFR